MKDQTSNIKFDSFTASPNMPTWVWLTHRPTGIVGSAVDADLKQARRSAYKDLTEKLQRTAE